MNCAHLVFSCMCCHTLFCERCGVEFHAVDTPYKTGVRWCTAPACMRDEAAERGVPVAVVEQSRRRWKEIER